MSRQKSPSMEELRSALDAFNPSIPWRGWAGLQLRVRNLRVCLFFNILFTTIHITGESFTLKLTLSTQWITMTKGSSLDLKKKKLLQVFSADRKAFHNRCITCQVLLLILHIQHTFSAAWYSLELLNITFNVLSSSMYFTAAPRLHSAVQYVC